MKNLLLFCTMFYWNCALCQSNNTNYQICVDAIKAAATIQRIHVDVASKTSIQQAIKTLESKTTELWGSGKATSVIIAGGVPIPVTSQGSAGFTQDTKKQFESYFSQTSQYSMTQDFDFYIPDSSSLTFMLNCIDKIQGNSNLLISPTTVEGNMINFSIRTKTPDVKNIEVKNIVLSNATLILPVLKEPQHSKITITNQETLFKMIWLDTSKSMSGDIVFASIDPIKHIYLTPAEKNIYKASIIDTSVKFDSVIYIREAGIKIGANYEDKGGITYINLTATTNDGTLGNCSSTMLPVAELKNNYYFLSTQHGRSFMTYLVDVVDRQVKFRIDEVIADSFTNKKCITCKKN